MNQRTIDEFISHYGVKGMRWGVRRKGGVSKGTGVKPVSGDALRTKKIKDKAKKHGTSSVSNKELRVAIERMNLEQQYSRLSAPPKSTGRKFVEGLLTELGKNKVKNVLNSSTRIVGNAFKKEDNFE